MKQTCSTFKGSQAQSHFELSVGVYAIMQLIPERKRLNSGEFLPACMRRAELAYQCGLLIENLGLLKKRFGEANLLPSQVTTSCSL